MKLKCIMVCLLGFISIYTTWITPVHAFMENYRSGDKGDMAILSGFKISTIEYESSDTDAGDIDRKIFSLGLSRSVYFGMAPWTFGIFEQGINPQGIGVVGMLLNFGVALGLAPLFDAPSQAAQRRISITRTIVNITRSRCRGSTT